MSASLQADDALALAEREGVIRARDARDAGIHPEVLRRLVDRGLLVKVGRGLYAPATAEPSSHHDLALAAARVPHGVVCLLSALGYHEIGTQLPHEVWMMVDKRSHKPRISHPPMRFILASGPTLTLGVDSVIIDGRSVRIFDPAKTVVDCFRYRRHIGLDAAIEALREALRERRCTPDQIERYASRCRVSTVIRPYLEAIA